MIKFIKIYDNLCVNYVLELLDKAYSEKNFIEINNIFQQYIYNNMFISNKNKFLIFKSYQINIKLKNIINKCIYNWKFKKNKSINKSTLILEDINDLSNEEKIILFSKYKKFTFSVSEIVNIIINSLEKRDDLFPTPDIPLNPYTNSKFQLGELIYLYNKIECFYRRSKKKIPFILTIFNECKYDIKKLERFFRTYLIEKTCENYVKDLCDSSWIETFKEFLFDFNLENKICMKCIHEIEDYRKVFHSVLVNYQMENNFYPNVNKSYKLFKKKIVFYKLGDVCLKHRKYYKYKRIKKGFQFSPQNLNETQSFNFSNIDTSNFVFTANSQS